jgi:tetratricopeptide (TPR) repeat protein
MLLHDKSDLDGAEAMLRRALAIYDEAYDQDHQYTASALTELGAVLNSAGRLDEALGALARAVAIRLRDYAPDHELVAGTWMEYADTLTRLGRYEEAGELLERSRATLHDRPGRRRDRMLLALQRLEAARSGTP